MCLILSREDYSSVPYSARGSLVSLYSPAHTSHLQMCKCRTLIIDDPHRGTRARRRVDRVKSTVSCVGQGGKESLLWRRGLGEKGSSCLQPPPPLLPVHPQTPELPLSEASPGPCDSTLVIARACCAWKRQLALRCAAAPRISVHDVVSRYFLVSVISGHNAC